MIIKGQKTRTKHGQKTGRQVELVDTQYMPMTQQKKKSKSTSELRELRAARAAGARFCHSDGACVLCQKNDQYFIPIPCGSGCAVCPACLYEACGDMNRPPWTVCPSCAKPISNNMLVQGGTRWFSKVQHCKGDNWLKTVNQFYAAIQHDDTDTMHEIMQTLPLGEQVQLANSCRADDQTTPVLARVLHDPRLNPDDKQPIVQFLVEHGASRRNASQILQPGENYQSESWVGELKKAQEAIFNAFDEGAPGVHTMSLTHCAKLLSNILTTSKLQEQPRARKRTRS